MSMLASGVGFVDQPNEHLLYSHYLIGKGLAWLYSQAPAVAWYSVYLFSAQCLSMIAMVNIIIRRTQSKVLLVMLPTFFLAVCLRPTQYMQFTTTAELVSTAAALYLFEALERKSALSTLWKPLTLSFLLFMGGTLIRFQSARAIAVLSALFVVCWLFTRFDWNKLKIGIPFIALVALCISGLEYENSAYYQRSQWREFYQLNLPRFRLTEFGRTNKLTPVIVSAFKTVNWSPADNWMLSRFYLLDQNNFSLDKLRKLDSLVPEVKNTNIKEIASDLWTIFKRVTIAPILLAIGLTCLITEKTSFSVRSRILFVLGLVAASVVLLITMKLPVYVFAGLAAFVSAALIWAAAAGQQTVLAGSKLWLRSAVVCILLLFLAIGGIAAGRFRAENELADAQRKILRTNLSRLDKQFLYVVWAYAFPYSAIRPFENLNDYFGGLKLLGINFLGRTPANLDRLRQFQITDLMAQLDNPQIRLISNDEFDGKIQEYVEQHYNETAKFTDISNFSKLGFGVYKVSLEHEKSAKKDLDQQWLDYLAKVAGFNAGTGGSIVVSENLGCHSANPSFDLSLFPSQEAGGQRWKCVEMKPVIEKRSLYFLKARSIPRCSNCKLDKSPISSYESTGKLPTLSHCGTLQINPREFKSFFVEIAAPEQMETNRAVLVEFNLPSSKPWKFLIPLQIDSALHRYEFDLSKLGFGKDELITDINVHPIYLRESNEKRRFSIGEIGFVRQASAVSKSGEENSPLKKAI